MTVGFFVSRATTPENAGSVAFFDAYASVRHFYADVSAWTGLTVEQILTGQLPDEHGARNAMLAVRSIAGQLAVQDVLATAGIRPSLVVALSLGISSATVTIGSLGREDLFRMLWHRRTMPGAGPEPEGVAFCHLDPESDPADYQAPVRAGVHIGVDFGPSPAGAGRNVMLSGYRAALERLAAEDPVHVTMIGRGSTALHSPLRQASSDFLRAYVAKLPFRDPRIPLAACLDDRVLTTAGEVRDAVWRNQVRTADISLGLRQAVRHGVGLIILPGPSMAEGLIRFPAPVLPVTRPADVQRAVAAAQGLAAA